MPGKTLKKLDSIKTLNTKRVQREFVHRKSPNVINGLFCICYSVFTMYMYMLQCICYNVYVLEKNYVRIKTYIFMNFYLVQCDTKLLKAQGLDKKQVCFKELPMLKRILTWNKLVFFSLFDVHLLSYFADAVYNDLLSSSTKQLNCWQSSE